MRRIIKHSIQNLHETSKYQSIKYHIGALNEELIQMDLLEDGYSFFRNTNLENDLSNPTVRESANEHLQQCLFQKPSGKSMEYTQGTDVRTKVNEHGLMNVSVAPPKVFMQYHNELTYTPEFPKIAAFICIEPAEFEGYTPLSNSIRVWNDMPQELKNKCEQRGIRYYRNLYDATALDQVVGKTSFNSYQHAFGTDDKETIEYLCTNKYGYQFEWTDCQLHNHRVRALKVHFDTPAVIHLNDTDTSFANNFLAMHPRIFDFYEDLGGFVWDVNIEDRPYYTKWGDGSEWSDKDYALLSDLYHKHSICFEWQSGDIVIINNLEWAHARYPFGGSRQRNILGIFGIPYQRDTLNYAVPIS